MVVRRGTRVVVPLVAAVIVGFAAFLAWQVAIPRYQASQPVPQVSASEDLALPDQVFDPSPYVPATDSTGAPGPVGMVFQGRRARDGLTGQVADPWYTVSARTGEYRRLVAPYVSEARRLWVGPQGTKIAWSSPAGVTRYDTMTGESRSYPNATGAVGQPLVWSPDSTRIAFGTDPVRVLDTRSGEVTDVPLSGRGTADAPAWTPNGQWLTVAGADAVDSVEVSNGRHRTIPAPVGELRELAWNAAGDLGGVHPKRFGDVLRVVRAPGPDAGGPAKVLDARPDLVIDGLWGWVDRAEVVVVGTRAETGGLEQAVALSVPDDVISDYMAFPSFGDNWAGAATVSTASDLLAAPTQAYDEPAAPWSPTAQLVLCMLVAVFPVLYFLITRRPKAKAP